MSIENGTINFNPIILQKSEIKADNTLNFTYCGVPVKYSFAGGTESYISVNGIKHKGTSLSQNESKDVFARNGKITSIQVEFSTAFGK